VTRYKEAVATLTTACNVSVSRTAAAAAAAAAAANDDNDNAHAGKASSQMHHIFMPFIVPLVEMNVSRSKQIPISACTSYVDGRLAAAKGVNCLLLFVVLVCGPPCQTQLQLLHTPFQMQGKDYFFDKKKVQLFFTLEFHAVVRGE
jgi:hypothetical protein